MRRFIALRQVLVQAEERGEELEDGAINHALAWRIKDAKGPVCDYVASTGTCQGQVSYPACATDGSSSNNTIPYGTRFQLDPSWDFSGQGFSDWETTYATALRDYGAIVMDQTSGFRPFLPLGSTSYTAFGQHDELSVYAGTHSSDDGIAYQGSTDRYDFTPPSVLWSHLKVVTPASNVGYDSTNTNHGC